MVPHQGRAFFGKHDCLPLAGGYSADTTLDRESGPRLSHTTLEQEADCG